MSAFDFRQPALAGLFMTLVTHLDVVLRKAFRPVRSEETAVTTVEDIYFRVSELRIIDYIHVPVMAADVFGNEWGSMDGVFAVKNEERRWRRVFFE